MAATEVHVCQAGSCRMRGSEAVLLEIEELAAAVDPHCSVHESGCLGLCNQAPSAVVLKNKRTEEIVHTRIDSMDKSAAVVVSATGKNPPVNAPEVQARLSGVRAMRIRENAIAVYRWNGALKATAEQVAHLTARGEEPGSDLVNISLDLFSAAGFPEGVRSSLDMPTEIREYSQWTLERVSQLSKHSAVFHFRSTDRKRGTPNPRGGGRGPPMPKTWHTTLLGEVGKNDEGPLPWVERDYTPISTAKEWEKGTCDILIKIYPDGAATSWLHRTWLQAQASAEPGSIRVWLSKPVQTLSVPFLVTDSGAFNPASVLLLLAGTGVVAFPQILQHRDPYGKIGISTRRGHQLHVPVDLILSCRMDDILMLPEIRECCQEASDFAASDPEAEVTKGLRHCTLLLTDKGPALDSYPFPDADCNAAELAKLESLPNARVLRARLGAKLVAEAVARMPQPCRFVVSGPAGFNGAAREMLLTANVNEDAITVLEA